jgi:hypothetical protein
MTHDPSLWFVWLHDWAFAPDSAKIRWTPHCLELEHKRVVVVIAAAVAVWPQWFFWWATAKSSQ